MNGDEKSPQSFSWARRWSAVLSLAITLAAVLALVAMVNYLAIRHFTRFHWNRHTEAELSLRTRQVLAALTNTVKITVFYNSEDPLFPRIKGLLKEYQFASPRIDVRYVDYLRDGTAARNVKREYKLTSANDKDVIIFESNGGSVVANSGELSDYDYSNLIAGKGREVYRTAFKGELVFTSRIYAIASGRRPVGYYLMGNGEHPPGGDSPESYGKFLTILAEENNFDLRPLTLLTNSVPADASMVIIAGPRLALAGVELDKIHKYLEQGGRAIITFNSLTTAGRPTGLEKLLERWGVDVGENVILDQENSVSGTGDDIVPLEPGAHPIVNAARNGRVLLYRPRSMRALRPGGGRSDDAKVDELLFTGPKTVVLDPKRLAVDPTQVGPKPLMVVVEKSVPGVQRGATRIVAVGDSTLWSNGFIEADANREFAAACANWLVNQSVLLSGIAPRPVRNYKVTLTQTQLRSAQLILLGGLPGTVLFIGLLVWLRRRR